MKVIVDLCIVPLGAGVSLSPYVAACERVLTEAGLKTALHANGTNIEGEWDAVFAAIKRCHEVVHEMGAPRVTATLRIGTRTDRAQTMEDKIRSVENQLADSSEPPKGANVKARGGSPGDGRLKDPKPQGAE